MASLVEHERHDDQRTPPLVARIQESGVLRNPPIATLSLYGLVKAANEL